MTLNETKFGKIVVELNNFTNLINPEAIMQFDNMTDSQLNALADSDSLTGKIASLYLDLLTQMREVSAPRKDFTE